jgi:probable phosphoglycerate mutase
MTTRVLCVRHGQSQDNVADVLSAVEPGCDLSSQGQRQATALGHLLRNEPIAHVYTSPLRRALRTAETIAGDRRLPVTVIPELREIGLGSLEGATASTREVTDDSVFRAWVSGRNLTHRFRGGERGTSVVARMRSALDLIADRHPNQSVVVVSHSGAMLAALANICAARPAGPLTLPPNCGVVTLVRGAMWHCVEWSAPQVGDAVDGA